MKPFIRFLLLLLLALPSIVEAASVRSDWMGAYLNRTKIGSSLLIVATPGSMAQVYLEGFELPSNRIVEAARVLYSEAELEFQAFGAKNRVEWRSVTLLERDYSISALGFLLSSGGAETKIVGEREENSITLTIGEPGKQRHQALTEPAGPLYVAEALPLVLAEKLRKGEEIEGVYRIFEPHQLTVSTWRVVDEGRETLMTSWGPVDCQRIKQDAGGIFPVVWIDGAGTVWKEFTPLGEDIGCFSYRETEAQARDKDYLNPLVLAEAREDPDGREPDLLYSTAIDAGTRIAHSSRVSRMVVDLWNFELKPNFPFSERQKNLGLDSQPVYTEDLPLRLEITTVQLPIPNSPFPSDFPIREKYADTLQEETFIEVNHPKILELAQRVTAGSKSPWEKALALYRWIQKNVETEFRITLPSAVEALESKKGDCNEQSALLTALVRAAGVPAKICTGLVYQEGAFYYHAWNEVLVQVEPEFWAPIDSAQRQETADATHIKFSEGGLPNQTYINGLIGKLKARISEIDLNDPDRAIN